MRAQRFQSSVGSKDDVDVEWTLYDLAGIVSPCRGLDGALHINVRISKGYRCTEYSAQTGFRNESSITSK